MTKRLWTRSLLAALSAILVLSSCTREEGAGGEARESSPTGRLRVVATTGMIADAARRVGGRDAEVTGLMGPGVDPHLYAASRQDTKRLLDADLVLYHGLHLEGKMVDFLKKLESEGSTQRLVVAVAARIPRERVISNPLFGEYPDPHIWFDLELWALAVDEVVRAFQARDPPRAARYAERGAALRREIEETHRWALETVRKIPADKRRLVTSHDAYNYFGRAYGFEVRGLQGISTVTKAGLRDIEEAVKYVRNHGIRVIFAETSVSPAAVQRVATSAGCRVSPHELYSDALGAPGTSEETFLGVFRYNLRTIVEAIEN